MTPEPIRSTLPLHLINDGGAFDPERHPHLRKDTDCTAFWWEMFWFRMKQITDTNSRLL